MRLTNMYEHARKREPLYVLLFTMVATAVFGELKMNPFGDIFRFSLGSAVFFFTLLFYRRLSPVLLGLCVGSFVVLFRVGLDRALGVQASNWASFATHMPAIPYYLIFAVVVRLTSMRKLVETPVVLGLSGAAADFTANFSELLTRHFTEGAPLNGYRIVVIAVMAFVRSFLVVGFYMIIQVRQLRAVGAKQQEKLDVLLPLVSGLYEEAFYLRKSSDQLEQLTARGYELYRLLLDEEKAGRLPVRMSGTALWIAQQVHEVKKDVQRILAALAKLIEKDRPVRRVSVPELLEFVARTNRNYAAFLGKQVEIVTSAPLRLETDQIYTLLAVFNNLVANAIEAIEHTGHVFLRAFLQGPWILFTVANDGPPIPDADLEHIFEPGFTTKYDRQGNPSTGIGLAHVRDLVSALDGQIEVSSAPGETVFTVRIPSEKLIGEEVPPC
ncbi:MAG: sensor histidine kinase [Alicyclobacillaceae bacterium]|nr:sensor histidine kinase [Alicyclobacillaceae bacterium]